MLFNESRENQSPEKGRKMEPKQRWQTIGFEKETDGKRCCLGHRPSHFPFINLLYLDYTTFYWHGITQIPGSSCNLGQMPTSFRASVPHLQNGYNDSTYLADFENKVLSGPDAWCFRRRCKKVIWQQVSGFRKILKGRTLETYMFISYDFLGSNGNLSWLTQRWKWLEARWISHRVKGKAERPSFRKDLEDRSSQDPQ